MKQGRKKILKPYPHLDPPEPGDREYKDPSEVEFLPEDKTPLDQNGLRFYASAALTALLARVGTVHPLNVTACELECYVKTSFDIADCFLTEEKRRYG